MVLGVHGRPEFRILGLTCAPNCMARWRGRQAIAVLGIFLNKSSNPSNILGNFVRVCVCVEVELKADRSLDTGEGG